MNQTLLQFLLAKRDLGFDLTLDISEEGWLLTVWGKFDKDGGQQRVEAYHGKNYDELCGRLT